jgi:putative membrane protein
VVGSVADLDVVVLVPFAIGAVLGLMAASRALRWLYMHAWDGTLAVMTGLIAGSLVRVWPWRSEDGFAAGVPGVPGAESAALLVGVVLVAAFAVVTGLERWARQRAPA